MSTERRARAGPVNEARSRRMPSASMSSNRRLTAAPSSARASPIWVRATPKRRSVASLPQAGNPAAAGAEAGDVERVQGDAVAADPAVHDQRRRATLNQADVGRGAAHVERDQVPLADQPRRVDAAGDAAGRPGQYGAGGQPAGFG